MVKRAEELVKQYKRSKYLIALALDGHDKYWAAQQILDARETPK